MADRSDHTQLITDLATAMHDTADADQTVQAIFEQSAQLLPEVSDISITVRRRRGTFDSLGSSSDFARSADELQYVLREGPCVEAASTDGEGLVRSGDLRTDRRWPTWGPRVADAGAGSMLSISMMSRGEPFGAINMYSREPGQFVDSEDVALAQLWATHAAAALSAARVESNLHTAVSARHTIGIAQGIVMERYDLSTEASFRLLTRLASQLERRVHAVASEIVRTRDIPHV